MKHLEFPILTLLGRLKTLKRMLENNPDDKRLQNAVRQHEHGLNVLKKAEERK
jgi:hypothetical protein